MRLKECELCLQYEQIDHPKTACVKAIRLIGIC